MGKASEIAHRSHCAESGAYIVEAGYYRRCICCKVKIVYGNKQAGQNYNNHIHHKIGYRISRYGFVNRLSLQLDNRYGARMQKLFYFLFEILKDYYKTAYLESSARGACASAKKHKKHKHCFGKLGEIDIKVSGGKARCGYY